MDMLWALCSFTLVCGGCALLCARKPKVARKDRVALVISGVAAIMAAVLLAIVLVAV